jgi:hypothetical protein
LLCGDVVTMGRLYYVILCWMAVVCCSLKGSVSFLASL